MFDPGQRLGPAVEEAPVVVVDIVAGILMTLLVVGPPVGINEDCPVTRELDAAVPLVKQ